MSMSRKDFELLARTIRELRRTPYFEAQPVVHEVVAERIANALDAHSSTFQKQRFLEACFEGRKK